MLQQIKRCGGWAWGPAVQPGGPIPLHICSMWQQRGLRWAPPPLGAPSSGGQSNGCADALPAPSGM
jgi:hypothetical protein